MNRKNFDMGANSLLIGLSIPTGLFALMALSYHGYHGAVWAHGFIGRTLGGTWATVWSSLVVISLIIALITFCYQVSREDGNGKPKKRRPLRGAFLALAIILLVPSLGTPAACAIGYCIKAFALFFYGYFLEFTGSEFFSGVLTFAMGLSLIAGLAIALAHWHEQQKKLIKAEQPAAPRRESPYARRP